MEVVGTVVVVMVVDPVEVVVVIEIVVVVAAVTVVTVVAAVVGVTVVVTIVVTVVAAVVAMVVTVVVASVVGKVVAAVVGTVVTDEVIAVVRVVESVGSAVVGSVVFCPNKSHPASANENIKSIENRTSFRFTIYPSYILHTYIYKDVNLNIALKSKKIYTIIGFFLYFINISLNIYLNHKMFINSSQLLFQS